MTDDHIVLPPSSEVRKCADVIEETVREFLSERATVLSGIGRYETEIETMAMTNLIVRHVEAAILLARHDLVLFPTACVVGRSAMETSARAIWLLTPNDPFERECRWLAHFESEIVAYERFLKMAESKEIEARLRQLMEFHAGVKSLLPDGYEVPKKIPHLRRMLEEIGRPERYLIYIKLSQYSHGARMASGTYLKHLGSAVQIGEHIDARDWGMIFAVCWHSLVEAGTMLIHRASGGPSPFPSPDLQKRVKETCESIK